MFFFVECHVDHAATENNTGNQHPVPIAAVVTNTGTHYVIYTVTAY